MSFRSAYIDDILGAIVAGKPDREFQFINMGYWPAPQKLPRTSRNLQRASRELNRLLIRACRLRDGQRVLDAGCGFGGTVEDVNARFRRMSLLGLNIDDRQILVAQSRIRAKNGNSVRFVCADACKIPEADAVFERILSVEAAMHFRSRRQFLKEAYRVLVPGGILALSDVIIARPANLPPATMGKLERIFDAGFGPLGRGWKEGDYAPLAASAGFKLRARRDITPHLLPSYRLLREQMNSSANGPARRGILKALRFLHWFSRSGAMRYEVLSFEK